MRRAPGRGGAWARAVAGRAGWMAAGWMLATLALPGAGRAEQVVAGDTLTVSDPCAMMVELREDAALAGGQVGVAAEPESAGPSVSGGGSVRVGGPCRAQAARLRLRVSPGMAVRLSGDAAWRVESMGGAVDATLGGSEGAEFGTMRVLRLRRTGSGDTHVDAVSERFEATQSSTGDVTVDRLGGSAALHVADNGTVTVDHAALDSLEVAGGGDGEVTLHEGRAGRLAAAMAGDAVLHADIVAGSASLVARGDAHVEVARVDGALSRLADEDATVIVREGAGATAVAATGATTGAGDAAASAPRRHAAHRGGAGWGAAVLLALAVLGGGVLAWRMRRAGARRASQAGAGDAGVQALGQRLAAVEARVVRVERYVTSGEMELHRQFRDLAGQEQPAQGR